MSHIITTLVANGLTDSTQVIECLVQLVQSEYVDVTETVADATWAIGQHLGQDVHKLNTSNAPIKLLQLIR